MARLFEATIALLSLAGVAAIEADPELARGATIYVAGVNLHNRAQAYCYKIHAGFEIFQSTEPHPGLPSSASCQRFMEAEGMWSIGKYQSDTGRYEDYDKGDLCGIHGPRTANLTLNVTEGASQALSVNVEEVRTCSYSVALQGSAAELIEGCRPATTAVMEVDGHRGTYTPMVTSALCVLAGMVVMGLAQFTYSKFGRPPLREPLLNA